MLGQILGWALGFAMFIAIPSVSWYAERKKQEAEDADGEQERNAAHDA